jgi:methylthioribose-1-phosphate isomerase
MRSIDWVQADGAVPAHIRLLDQTQLPDRTTFIEVHDPAVLIDSIRRLAVRGAPALGVAGAMGVALAAQNMSDDDARAVISDLRQARPTAVNLARGVDAALAAYSAGGAEAALAAALRIRDDDIAACTAMAGHGTALLRQLVPGADSLTVMTICNTGALATVEHGTALGVIERLHEEGSLARALVCETRPLLQGSRLTAWELQQMAAPFDVIVDSAAASILATGDVHAVVVGADRIAANGDTANKIGTFALAIAARHAGVPFLVVAPDTTVDLDTPSGRVIEIEDRGAEEVCTFRGVRSAPEGSSARNPAFDVTPAGLITAIVTDTAVIHLSNGETPADRMGVAST